MCNLTCRDAEYRTLTIVRPKPRLQRTGPFPMWKIDLAKAANVKILNMVNPGFVWGFDCAEWSESPDQLGNTWSGWRYQDEYADLSRAELTWKGSSSDLEICDIDGCDTIVL